jgi:hypothetical protein
LGWWLNRVTECKNGTEGAEGGFAVISFFGFGQVGIRDKTGMLLSSVIAGEVVRPTLGKARGRPKIVGVFGEALSEGEEGSREDNGRRINGGRLVTHNMEQRWGVRASRTYPLIEDDGNIPPSQNTILLMTP